jgi:dynactin complex subunit
VCHLSILSLTSNLFFSNTQPTAIDEQKEEDRIRERKHAHYEIIRNKHMTRDLRQELLKNLEKLRVQYQELQDSAAADKSKRVRSTALSHLHALEYEIICLKSRQKEREIF